MKKSRIKMITAIAVIVMLSFTFAYNTAAGVDNKFIESTSKQGNLSYDQAMKSTNIKQAMYEQIIDNFMHLNWPYYTVHIKYNETKIYIQGSYAQWFIFFRDQIDYKRTHMQ